jgi:predicted NAD/FAD-dependent oxidoreductase
VSDSTAPVVVVGAGIAGVSCARTLVDAGHDVRVLDRGHRIGGRMAVRTEDLPAGRHAVDVGASYFTVRDERFQAVVDDWRAAGLARVWTDTFRLLSPEGRVGTTTGLPRWAAAGGLRSLVEHLAGGLDVRGATEVEEVEVNGGRLAVDGEPARAVVLAMPDPQAADLLPEPVATWLELDAGLEWSPAIAVWGGWETPWWGDLDGAFVDGSAVVSWVADDGRRRGDGAAVLVAHTTSVFAAGRIEDPGSAVQPVLREVAALLDVGRVPEPRFTRAHRWSLAAPLHQHPAPFGLHPALVGVCGDAWGERSRIEQAWLSGRLLGQELAERLA